MATLQKIRNRAGLLIAVIGVALLAFIMGDLLTSGNTFLRKYQDKAFVVDGEIISTQQYFDRVSEWEDFQKMISNENSLDENATSQIRDIVYQQMVKERLLDLQSKKLGLTVSKEELNDLVHGETISPLLQQLPLFVNPETGVFDKSSLIGFLSTINTDEAELSPEQIPMVRQYRATWLFIENLIKYQRLEEKYGNLLSSAVMVNDVEAETAFAHSQESADIMYAVQNYYSIPDSVASVTDAEIKSYYNENQHMFKTQNPLAKVTYFAKEVVPSDEDFAEVEALTPEVHEKLLTSTNVATVVSDYSDVPYSDVYISPKLMTVDERSFVESAQISDVYGPFRDGDSFKLYKYIGKTVAPDSVKVRMIAIPEGMPNDSLVTSIIDSIYTIINNGEDFADVANQLDPRSNGGELGWVREIDLAQAGSDVAQKIFSIPVGTVTRLELPGQQTLVYVEEKTAPITKYKLAIVNMPVIVSDKTQNNIDNELNQFVSDPNIKTKFTELAQEKGYSVVPSTMISSTDHLLGQMPGSRQIVNWVMNEKEGAIKKFDLSKSRVIARIDKLIPAGFAPLSEVSNDIRSILLRDKKAETVIADLESKNLSTLQDYSAAMDTDIDSVRFVDFNTQNITNLGYEPVLNAYAAYAPLNSVVGPFKGNAGVFVINVFNRDKSEDEYDAKQQKATMQSNNLYRLQSQAVEVLKEKMKVVDNRYKFY
ncbi:MAG: SurA N-terminal domain-containing protein [Dysgonamonadaceae bacterium]|nr:SurA N-terminal domain-containing protein [Dysgonamonadaceae bacterium]